MSIRWIWLVPALLAAAGCGDNRTSLRGKVSCNGEPVKYGHILFQSVDGEKPAGADIFDGVYELRELSPGKKRVLIKSKPGPRRVPASSIEREHVELIALRDPIRPDAEGNNEVVEVSRAGGELDFALKQGSPKK